MGRASTSPSRGTTTSSSSSKETTRDRHHPDRHRHPDRARQPVPAREPSARRDREPQPRDRRTATRARPRQADDAVRRAPSSSSAPRRAPAPTTHARRPKAVCPRRAGARHPSCGSRSTRRSSVSPAGSSSTAGSSSPMLAALGTFGASLLAFLWPSSSGGFGGMIAAGKLSDITSYMATNLQPFYVPEARTYIQPYPSERVAERPRRSTTTTSTRAWSRASSPCTRSACTSAAASRGASRRSGSSAPATARSTTGSARSATVRRRVASTASRRSSRGGSVSINTGLLVGRSADRHQHHRSGRRRPALRRLRGRHAPHRPCARHD